MAGLSPGLQELMRRKAQTVRERLAGTGKGNWQPRWDLIGKNAIVQPGREAMARLLPRWDFASKFVAGGRPNPQYREGPIFVEAKEHWWDGPDGKLHHEWCPTTLDQNAPCPICEAWEVLRASKVANDKELAKRIRPQDVYLFNAILGPTSQRVLGQDGQVDIRYMPLPGTAFVQIMDIMTGGETGGDFARGDVSDPREGSDLKLTRPAGQGDRWKVDCSAKPTTLFLEAQKGAFVKWWERLVNLQEMIEQDMKQYDTLYAAFHGEAAPGDGIAPATDPGSGPETDPFVAPEDPTDPFASMGGPGTDIEMPGEAPAPAPSRAPAPGARRPMGRR